MIGMDERLAKVADCGAAFDHDAHVYRTERGKVLACDGSTTKRADASLAAAEPDAGERDA